VGVQPVRFQLSAGPSLAVENHQQQGGVNMGRHLAALWWTREGLAGRGPLWTLACLLVLPLRRPHRDAGNRFLRLLPEGDRRIVDDDVRQLMVADTANAETLRARSWMSFTGILMVFAMRLPALPSRP
jgi:hypothetical protein